MSLASPPSRAAEQRDELAPSYTRDEGFPPRSGSAASSADLVLGPWGRPESFWIATRRSAPPGRRSKDSIANKALLRREISIPALCQLWVIRAERPQHFSISPLRR